MRAWLSKHPGRPPSGWNRTATPRASTTAQRTRTPPILAQVAALAQARGVSMTEISLAWLLTKVTSPVVGMTKPSHVTGAPGRWT